MVRSIQVKRWLYLTVAAVIVIAAFSSGAIGVRADDDLSCFDVEQYAKEHGVTVEEAYRRLNLQSSLGNLEPALISSEPDTFAGLWLEHTPTYKLVVAFTHDPGEEKIKHYLSGLAVQIEVRIVQFSYAYLKAAQLEIDTSLRNMGITSASGINLMENRVEVRVEDRTELDQAVQDGRLVVPEGVIISVGGLPILLGPPLQAVDINGWVVIGVLLLAGSIYAFVVIKGSKNKGRNHPESRGV